MYLNAKSVILKWVTNTLNDLYHNNKMILIVTDGIDSWYSLDLRTNSLAHVRHDHVKSMNKFIFLKITEIFECLKCYRANYMFVNLDENMCWETNDPRTGTMCP